jgi:hypothetical protein
MPEQETNRKPGTFPPGVSGNPNGRPPKGYSITEWFRDMLNSKPEVKDSIGKAILEKALAGDQAAQKLIWNYMDGMPLQGLELTGKNGEDIKQNLTIKFV